MAEEQIEVAAQYQEAAGADDLIAMLRGLLAEAPSAETWAAILRLFREAGEGGGSLDLALAYAEEHLRAWPPSLRMLSIDELLRPCGVLGRSLWVCGDDSDALQEPLVQSRLAQLALLEIYDCYPDSMSCGNLLSINTAMRLQTLRFVRSELDRDEMELLFASPLVVGLEELDLACCALSGAELVPLLTCPRLSSLRTLSLADNYLATEEIKSIAATPCLKGLRSLDLSLADMNDGAIQALCSSAHLKELKHLALTTDLSLEQVPHTLTPRGLLDLLYPSALESLEELHFTAFESYDDSGSSQRTLAQRVPTQQLPSQETNSNGCASFQSIQIVGMPLLLPILRSMLASPKIEGLKLLDLSGAKIGNEGLEVLASCPGLRALEELHLEDCEIGDSGLLSLVLSPHLHNLRRLSLRDNVIGAGGGPMASEAVIALARSPHFQSLEELSLIGNPLPEEALQALADVSNFPKLWKIFVGGESYWKRHATMLSPAPAHIEIATTWEGSISSRPPGVSRDVLQHT